MKWIGQHIYDLVSKFRNDVYLEDISTGTIASGAHLGLDSNNKIVKAVDGGGDLTSIVAGTGLSGTSLTGPIPTLNVDAAQTQITSIGSIATGEWNGTPIATDQQKHLANFEFKGFSVGDGNNYMIPEINSDTKAPFEHQTSTGSAGTTATSVITLLRASGHVMHYAGTLKYWNGWVTSSGTGQTVDIGLYKVTLVSGSATDVSPVLLKNTSFTSVGNTKALTMRETSFSVAFAAGDILISAVRNGTSTKRCDFASTLEVEWE